jgi:type I restriction enzyme S subunit
MEVTPGYKQSEVGVIPEEWEVRNLSDVSRKITDGDHVTPMRTSQGYYLLSARNVLNGRIDVSDVDYVGFAEYQRMKQRCGPEAGDILISCSGTIGRVTVVPVGFECVLVRSAALAKIDPELADGVFLQFWLQGSKAQWQIASSVNQGAQPNLFLNHIERLLCPRPPLPEQRAIATALSDVDGLLGALDRLIAKKRDLKQAAMQQLLTGQTRLPGFHGEWDMRRLGDVASVSKGTQLHSSEANEGGKFAHLNGGITPSSYTNKSNTAGNTIAISEGGNSCGFVQFMQEPYWCGGHCYSVIPNGADNHFLYHSLKGQQSAIMALRVGSGLPNVQKTGLLDFKISIPETLPEQTAIATVLTTMDAELAGLEQQRAKTAAIKQGMMQGLLTGRIRLLQPEALHA